MGDLFNRSVEIILANQNPSGAYVASPNFPTYRYCWFRDGAFIAYAMDLAGEHASAARFHAWAAAVVNARAAVVRRVVAKARQGEPVAGADLLHTRYALDGSDGIQEAWPNFQLDGFGTWLWALEEHQRLSQTGLPDEWLLAADVVSDYLTALWPRPCYDCWEEFPDRVHAHTLAAIRRGLQSHARLGQGDHRSTLASIKDFLRNQAVADGHFVKFVGSREVDASLLALATPYQVVPPNDPLMRATLARIETDLRRGGGLHRYAADTYYGGGEWVLLTAWLGWYYAQAGEPEKAQTTLNWVEAQADAQGHLPEQVPATLNDPAYYSRWRERWGEIASPLLWSHAKYLILSEALRAKRVGDSPHPQADPE